MGRRHRTKAIVEEAKNQGYATTITKNYPKAVKAEMGKNNNRDGLSISR
jgi:hypothetical protein